MYNKKICILISTALLVSIVMVTLIQVWGIPMRDLIEGIILYALVGVLIASYLMRFVLIVLGVLALYQILLERYNKRMTSQTSLSPAG